MVSVIGREEGENWRARGPSKPVKGMTWDTIEGSRAWPSDDPASASLPVWLLLAPAATDQVVPPICAPEGEGSFPKGA